MQELPEGKRIHGFVRVMVKPSINANRINALGYSILFSPTLNGPPSNWSELLCLTHQSGQTNFTNKAANAQSYHRAKELP
jgi:hypothetical protein